MKCNFDLFVREVYTGIFEAPASFKALSMQTPCKRFDTEEIAADFTNFCIDERQSPTKIYGDSRACEGGSCQYYLLSIKERLTTGKGCSAKFPKNDVVLTFTQNSMHPNPGNFTDPWERHAEGTTYRVDKYKTTYIYQPYDIVRLTTSARLFGLWDASGEEERYTPSKPTVDSQYRDPVIDTAKPLFEIMMYASKRTRSINRGYPTMVDTLSDIGGIMELIFIPCAIMYGFYLNKAQENDLIHKAIMLSGKFGLAEEEMEFLDEIYPPENYINKNSTRFRCWCCKRKAFAIEEKR
jgi:hypothetical protein